MVARTRESSPSRAPAVGRAFGPSLLWALRALFLLSPPAREPTAPLPLPPRPTTSLPHPSPFLLFLDVPSNNHFHYYMQASEQDAIFLHLKIVRIRPLHCTTSSLYYIQSNTEGIRYNYQWYDTYFNPNKYLQGCVMIPIKGA